jgi:Ni/Fe-hydrogenase subunit HybB-like protein
MPVYCFVFLAFENLPLVLERYFYIGTPATRRRLAAWEPTLRRLYPWMIAGAYLLPMGHQSSLGALMLLTGTKLHPLWQTPWLPLLYLMQAVICGFAFVTFITMASCLMWRRPLDTGVLDELANWTSWTSLVWLGLRAADLAARGVLGEAFSAGAYAIVFWTETLLVAIPAVTLRIPRLRATPRWIFRMVTLTIMGGMAYRFVPTTIAFSPVAEARYFPAIPELLMTVGFIAVALAAYTVFVKRFAVLPAPLSMWYAMVDHDRLKYPHILRDVHGNPLDD